VSSALRAASKEREMLRKSRDAIVSPLAWDDDDNLCTIVATGSEYMVVYIPDGDREEMARNLECRAVLVAESWDEFYRALMIVRGKVPRRLLRVVPVDNRAVH
jgi:hypothetical protein